MTTASVKSQQVPTFNNLPQTPVFNSAPQPNVNYPAANTQGFGAPAATTSQAPVYATPINPVTPPNEGNRTASYGNAGGNGVSTAAYNQQAYDQFRNPGGYLPPTVVAPASGTTLRPAPGAGGAYQTAPYQYGQPGYVQPGYNYAYNGGYRYAMPNSNIQGGTTLRPVNGGPAPAPQYSPVAQQRMVYSGGETTVPINQDPRFVSPPPAPRVGNFATSPYQGAYRLAGYQTLQPVANQTVLPPLTQATQPQVVANTSTLPQYQPNVGIYPTAYQYCAPGVPSNGVPQVVPGAVAPPTYPPNLAPQLYTQDNSGYRPLFSLGQENYNVQIGRGIIGQPTVYVPGQPVRNFIRYISP